MTNDQQPAVADTGDGGLLRVRMLLSYDGGPFSGWAVQPGLMTVQGVLEEALAKLIRRPVRITVAGRTDAGVHARGQVVHIDLTEAEWRGLNRGRDVAPEQALQRRLHGVLNKILQQATPQPGARGEARIPSAAGAIQIGEISLAPPGFDARFSALWRRYSYRIADDGVCWDPLTRTTTLWHREQLDVDRMNEAAEPLLGLQDFLAYCRPREGATTIRELQRFEFARGEDGIITATVQADAFCHNMVRCLVGAALQVGSGARGTGWLWDRLLARVRDAQAKVAPAHPLVLEEVRYPAESELLGRAEATRARRGED